MATKETCQSILRCLMLKLEPSAQLEFDGPRVKQHLGRLARLEALCVTDEPL